MGTANGDDEPGRLMDVEEGVATPEDGDEMWTASASTSCSPSSSTTRTCGKVSCTVLREYVDEGRLGVKSGRGF